MSAVSLDLDTPMDLGRSVSSAFREVSARRADEYVARGHARRHFFPHRIYQLPKCGPDGFLLAERMCGKDDPEAMWELVLYADPELLAEFPDELFFDDDLIWHRQQFGRPGQVATASLVLDGSTVYSLTHVSDLVQRISRRREHKTRIEKVFKGWTHMLLNAVMGFARERGAREVRIPTAALAGRHTDRARDPDLTLFERIYDHTPNAMLPARRSGDWWSIDVAAAADRLVEPERGSEQLPRRRTISVCHHVERGLGHLDFDPAFAPEAERVARRDLEGILRVEAELGIRTTYCVVGSLLEEVREQIEADGHCIAFHSFDHRVGVEGQLERCRRVDYRIKGYRAPNSKPTEELTDRNLLRRNFEWLGIDKWAVGAKEPRMQAGIVRVPMLFDDWGMHAFGVSFEDWEHRAVGFVDRAEAIAIGLHDCYAPRWLDRYRGLLERVGELGELRTVDELAAEITLASAA
jgi:hypothetical protein